MAPNHSHLSHSNYRQNKTKEMLKSFAHVNDTVKLEKSDTNEQYFQRISFLFFYAAKSEKNGVEYPPDETKRCKVSVLVKATNNVEHFATPTLIH